MKIKFTNKQVANILNESSEDYIVKAIKLLGGIHSDNIASVDMIRNIISVGSKGTTSLILGQDYDLDGMESLKDRIRFHEYWNRFTGTTDGRGFAFEGFIAGLFGGETTAKLNYEDSENNTKNPTQDVIVTRGRNKGAHISIKLVRDENERFSIGSYKKKFGEFTSQFKMVEEKTVRDFLMSDTHSYNLKETFLKTCLSGDIIFLFARIDKESRLIRYTICPVNGDDGIISRLLSNITNGKPFSGKSGPNSLGVTDNDLTTFEIKFPYVTEKEVQGFLPIDGGDRPMDKIYDIFNDEVKRYLRPEVLTYIYANKDKISSELQSLDESKVDLLSKLYDLEIEPSKYDDILSGLNDEDITTDFLRNLDRKKLKRGNTEENIINYITKYSKSLNQRQEPEVEHDDNYFVDDDEQQEKSKIGRKQYIKELRPLQVELLKLQEYVKSSGKSVVVVFEGRDSAGKGSTIKKFAEYLQPNFYKIVTMGIPTPDERKDWFGRYEREIESGKIIFFDRSWYNRGIVEPVMGYSSMEEYEDFMENVGSFEQSLLDKGHSVFKFWLSITQDTQRKRFDMRKNSPLKYWKFSPNDEASIDKWDDYTEFKEKAIKQTAEVIPWTVVDTNDKRAGGLNSIRAVLDKVEYEGKDTKNLGMIYPEVVTTIHEQTDSFMKRRVDKIVFRKIVNPRVRLTIEKYPNGKILSIENTYNIRFPYKIGEVINRGYETWANANGYEISIDGGTNFKGGPEKKKFGIPISLLPPHLKNL